MCSFISVVRTVFIVVTIVAAIFTVVISLQDLNLDKSFPIHQMDSSSYQPLSISSKNHSDHTYPSPVIPYNTSSVLLSDTYLPVPKRPKHHLFILKPSMNIFLNTCEKNALEESGTVTTLSILSLMLHRNMAAK